ncbi:DEAD/DEAH box helicase, partial [Duncaniella muris]|uniref:DEAD/DEAH box helicase n=1 Tax=Duncaniella muris TaxID=2094150 RepID=UPI0025B3C2B3
VIIVPSRELVLQIYEVIRRIATGFKTVAFYGGHPMADEVRSVIPEPDIIVATPGRLLDHLRRGTLSLDKTSALVLDEYDKSLELGFLADMKAIAGRLKNVSTIILTSATKLAELPDFLGRQPLKAFDYTDSNSAAEPDIAFMRVDSPSADKLETLDSLLRDLTDNRT